MYLVKALKAARAATAPGALAVDWTAGQRRLVEDHAIQYFRDHADTFTVLAGPDLGDCIDTLRGFVELTGDDAPDASARATLALGTELANNGLVFTAVAYGEVPNGYHIRIVQGTGRSQPISVDLDTSGGWTATITLPTDSDGDPADGAAEDVKDAWDASAAVAYVTVALAGDGSGAVETASSTPLAGGTGTGVGVAGPGSRYTRLTGSPSLYVNVGTAAQPNWSLVAWD